MRSAKRSGRGDFKQNERGRGGKKKSTPHSIFRMSRGRTWNCFYRINNRAPCVLLSSRDEQIHTVKSHSSMCDKNTPSCRYGSHIYTCIVIVVIASAVSAFFTNLSTVLFTFFSSRFLCRLKRDSHWTERQNTIRVCTPAGQIVNKKSYETYSDIFAYYIYICFYERTCINPPSRAPGVVHYGHVFYHNRRWRF